MHKSKCKWSPRNDKSQTRPSASGQAKSLPSPVTIRPIFRRRRRRINNTHCSLVISFYLLLGFSCSTFHLPESPLSRSIRLYRLPLKPERLCRVSGKFSQQQIFLLWLLVSFRIFFSNSRMKRNLARDQMCACVWMCMEDSAFCDSQSSLGTIDIMQ